MTPNPPFFSDKEADDLYRVLYDTYDCMIKDLEILTKALQIYQKDVGLVQKNILRLLNCHPTQDDLNRWRKSWEGMR